VVAVEEAMQMLTLVVKLVDLLVVLVLKMDQQQVVLVVVVH
jgi:hypothetical protein